MAALAGDPYERAHQNAVACGDVIELFPTEKPYFPHIGAYPLAGHVKLVPASESRVFDQDTAN